jgi:hypothetical protein
MTNLSPDDYFSIVNLNALHFSALDGLDRITDGNPSEIWADTFTTDGLFQTKDADGNVIFSVQGRPHLVDAHREFPDISTTRHWINNLLIEPHSLGARCTSYIIAMNIGINPASIIRAGTYDDVVVQQDGLWLYKQKVLILDPASPFAG